jgi:RimJ/RimL family protein N-acetyltransferase
MVDTLRTERLILRPLRASDAGPMTLYASDPRVARMTTSIPHPYPPGAAEAYIERSAGRAAERAWAIDAIRGPGGGDEMVGVISYRPATRSLAYWVGPPFWNTGYATEAVARLAEHLFATEPVEALSAAVLADNPASIHVLEKAGFAADGEAMLHSVARGAMAPAVIFSRARDARRTETVAPARAAE